MFKGITWGQFAVFILTIAGAYYLCVGLRYYGPELLQRIKERDKKID